MDGATPGRRRRRGHAGRGAGGGGDAGVEGGRRGQRRSPARQRRTLTRLARSATGALCGDLRDNFVYEVTDIALVAGAPAAGQRRRRPPVHPAGRAACAGIANMERCKGIRSIKKRPPSTGRMVAVKVNVMAGMPIGSRRLSPITKYDARAGLLWMEAGRCWSPDPSSCRRARGVRARPRHAGSRLRHVHLRAGPIRHGAACSPGVALPRRRTRTARAS